MNRLLSLAVTFTIAARATADSTISPTAKFAYSANAGWINFRPDQPSAPTGIVFGDYFLSGKAYSANVGWIDIGNGAPANGIRYANNSADFGVNHDGGGNLSGFAYSANTGWINFGWATTTDPARPRVNLATGAFDGYAYSANLGWINLGSGNLVTLSMTTIDSDSDGLADSWERANFSDLTTATATSDFDQDGVTDKTEYVSNTDPKNAANFFRIISMSFAAGFTQANVVFTSDPARLYRLETTDSLETQPIIWTDSSLATFAPDAGSSTTKVISWAGSSKKFIRAVAVKPLQP